MKLYICRRWHYQGGEFMGALLINADNLEEAIKIFKEAERGGPPKSVLEIDLSTKGVKYDDETR